MSRASMRCQCFCMPNTPSKKFGIASIIWALLLGVGIIALAGSILLPSTKRARIDLTEQLEEASGSAAPATTAPARGTPATTATAAE